MNLFFRLTIMIAAMASVVFVMWKLNTEGINPSVFHLDSSYTTSFDPKDVTRFEWRSAKKIFSYDRDDDGRWLPEANAEKLKDLLQFLSQIQLNQVEQKGKSSLDVSLDINGVRWDGSWDGLSFVWKTGPNVGKGEILSEQKNMAFFKGAHVFDTKDINLCKNRITQINVEAHGKNFQIAQVQRGWEVVQPMTQTLDPIFIEKWLIGLCKVKVRTILDLSYAPSNVKQGAVTFEFVDGEKLSLQQVEKDFFVLNNVGLVLDQLSNSLEDLKKQLQP